MHNAIKFSSIHHFADDTNMLLSDNSLKRLNKRINQDLKLTVEWIRANKLSLNVDKTEIIIFKPKNKNITKHLNFRISGQKIKPTTQVKYLGIILQDDLSWDKYLSNLVKKLSRAIGLLAKIRHYVPKYLLRTIYYSLFNSHLIYACEIWGQNQNNVFFRKISELQKKSLRLINFKCYNAPTDPLFKDNKILKISDFIAYKNVLFVRECLRKENLTIFNDMFPLANQNHNYNTRSAYRHQLDIPQTRTVHYGGNSFKKKAIESWHEMERLCNCDLVNSEFFKFKKEILHLNYDKYYS